MIMQGLGKTTGFANIATKQYNLINHIQGLKSKPAKHNKHECQTLQQTPLFLKDKE